MFANASSSIPLLPQARSDFLERYLKALHSLNALHLKLEVIPDGRGSAQVVTRTGILGVVEIIVPVRAGNDVLHAPYPQSIRLNLADAKILAAEINRTTLDLECRPILLPEHDETGAVVCATGSHPYRNYLFIVPKPSAKAAASHLSDERVTALARHLNNDGFAYVARAKQKEMEDDQSGVRYLPLGEHLPAFGIMTAVIVVCDPVWAIRAAAMYPEADIFMLELS